MTASNPFSDYFHGFRIHQKSSLNYGKPRPFYTPIGLILTSDTADKKVFPENEAMLLKTYNETTAAAAGQDGTLPDILNTISQFDFFPPTVIVRIKLHNDDKAQNEAIKIALKALVTASATFEVSPKIIGLPALMHKDIVPALEKSLDDLEAMAYIAIAAESDDKAIEAAEIYKHRRMMTIWPEFSDSDKNILSVVALALMMRSYVDHAYGPHHCISNLPIPVDFIDGITALVDWQTIDSVGNKLNKNHITTLIRDEGQFLFYGVRTRRIEDSEWLFESDVRMADVINGIVRSHRQKRTDRPGTAAEVEFALREINEDIANLVDKDWLLGGHAEIDYEQSNEEVLAQGGFYVKYTFTSPKPLEQTGATSEHSGRYLLSILPASTLN